MPPLSWQPSLLGQAGLTVDRRFRGLERAQLDRQSWVDYQAGWLAGADELFDRLVTDAPWAQRRRWMFDAEIDEPRLTASGQPGEAWYPAVLEEAREVLSAHYGVVFDSVGLNLYRDGNDSVAWHRDRIPEHINDPVVALVSLGESRGFRLRPHGGGRSRAFRLGGGDLLVTGGRTQRQWEHSVPKVARAGPRISVAFRHSAG